MNKTTSILNSFESGSFYSNRNYSTILFGDVEKQLNDIIIWVNYNLLPCVVNGTRHLDQSSIAGCIELAITLRKKFSKITSILKNHDVGNQIDYSNLYKDYSNSVCSNGFWRDLQEQQQVDKTLVLHRQTLPENLNLLECKATNSNKNESVKVPLLHSHQNCSESKSLVDVKQSLCSKCDCSKYNYKFNFIVDYDPTIKALLYGYKFMESIDVNRIKQSTIQFRTPNMFACLLCNNDCGFEKTLRAVREHLDGQRHKKNKSASAIKALSMYHKNWMKMEVACQAHQTHFYPTDAFVTFCRSCCVYVEYQKLEVHILGSLHKNYVMKLHRKESRSALLKIQASLYSPELIDSININMDAIIIGDRASYITEGNVDKERTDSEESEEDASVDGLPKIKGKKQTHEFVLSIANPSGKSLAETLEHRFLPHLDLLRITSNNEVKCRCCNVSIPNHPLKIKEHILSKAHVSECSIPDVKWHYYCEICDFHCSRYETWNKHIADPAHKECCNRLGLARKSTLCEYVCCLCTLVIFGDEISLKRHLKGKGIRRKKKEVVLSPELIEIFKTEVHIQNLCKGLVTAANEVLANPDLMIMCCRALEKALSETFASCKVYPFGSRVSGLGHEQSDLDVFVDLGDMYLGMKNQDAQTQEKLVRTVAGIFRKKRDQFSNLNPIPTARTPIIQIFHISTRLDCDLSFRHGLSVENSKFLRFCIEVQPVTQAMILLLKKWSRLCKLHENITTYALSMLVIYFLQVKKYLLPVQKLKLLNPQRTIIIDGWSVTDFSDLHDIVRSQVTLCTRPITQMLMEFFNFYKVFDYTNDVVCPLLGRPVKKSLFLNPNGPEQMPLEMLPYLQKLSNPNAEIFRSKSFFCIQDPFDLSHNLTKGCCQGSLLKFISYCELTSKHLKTIP